MQHSIFSLKVHVEEGTCVERSLLFHEVTVGVDANVRNCIIDKHVSVPSGEKIGFDLERDAGRFTVSENGIVVIPKNYRSS